MNHQSKEIIKKIVQLRNSYGIKPEDIASVLEISGAEYKRMERGAGEITLSQIFKIAEIFKMEAGSFFDYGMSMAKVNTPQGITEINFKITVKSQDPVDIESEIAKQYGLSKPTRQQEIIKKQGLARRRW